MGYYDTYAEEHAGGEDCRDDRVDARYGLERKRHMLRIGEYTLAPTNGVAQWYLLACKGFDWVLQL